MEQPQRKTSMELNRTRPTPSINFLDLPAEIRNRIYEQVLNNTDEDILCPFIWQCSPGKRKYTYSLTQTCRQIRSETLRMWHAGKKLLFAMRGENMPYYEQWLRRRPDEMFASIRRVQLEDYQHFKKRNPSEHPWTCRSAIIINLSKAAPVSWHKDRNCRFCPAHDRAADRVNAVVRAKGVGERVALTREKLEEIFEAAGWDV